MAITVCWACETRQGPRPRNEDSVQVEPGLAAAILADGMGGAAGGKEASTLAIATAVESLSRHLPVPTPPPDIPGALARLVTEVNQRVFEKGGSDPELHGMGSTLVVMAIRNGRYYCANVGDSRAYLVRGGTLSQISKDHSLVQERVDAGLITQEEAARQPDRNVLTRAIGTIAEVEPHLSEGEVFPDDVFVLTSDGVHGVVEEAQIAATGTANTPASAAHTLVEEALARGTRDNATTAVGKAEATTEEESLETLDRVLSYTTPEPAPTQSSGRGEGKRWLMAGATLLLLAAALAAITLR